MKKIILLSLTAILIASCGGDPLPAEKSVEKGPLEITIDNEKYNFYPTDVKAVIDNEKQMYVYITYAKLPNMTYDLVFMFDNDQFFITRMLRYIKDDKPYATADFDPLKWFSVKNYKFDPVTRDLYFEYEGKLFQSLSEVNTSSKAITIKGKVDLKGIEHKQTNQQNVPRVTFNTESFNFYSVRTQSMRNEQNDLLIEHNFFTNNGYRLMFTVNSLVSHPIPLPRSYSFDTTSTENCISFFQFTGEARQTDGIGQYVLRAQDWKKHPCRGSFTVTEIFHMGSKRVTKGTFAIDILEGDKVVHKVENGVFLY